MDREKENFFVMLGWIWKLKSKGLGQAGRVERGSRITLPGNPLCLVAKSPSAGMISH